MARILIVEDKPDNLELMRYLLSAYGHVVLVAVDGEEGLAAAQRELPELIVCDVHLPKVDGYEIARRLRADRRMDDIPLIAVTALAMVGDREKGLAAGFDGYISKPIDPEGFVPQVESYLDPARRGTPPAQRFRNNAMPAPRGRPTRGMVLVVDDRPINRELMRDTLEPFGYEVWLASSVHEAKVLANKRVPDIIVSDLHMPGEDGFNFIRHVKADARLTAVPFLFLSSSVWGEKDRDNALQLGVTRFLVRPIEPQALLHEIASCLPDGK